MNEFAQKPGENPAAWVERLARIRMEGLSDYLLSVLGAWKRDAAQQAGAPPTAPARTAEAVPSVVKLPAALRRPSPPAGELTPLEAAKRAVRALSADEMLRFTFWFTHGRADC